MTDKTPEEVLDPDDLELPDERVAEIDDGRYVIDVADSASESSSPPTDSSTDSRTSLRELRQLADAYAVTAAVKTDRGVAETSIRSDDISETFESFVRWYAGRIDSSSSPEEVLAVLASASDLNVSVDIDP